MVRGRCAVEGVQERKLHERVLPEREANVPILEHMECRRLGNTRRPGEDGLEEGAIRLLVQGVRRRRLRMGGPLPRLRGNHDDQVVGPVRRVAPVREAEGRLRLGAEEPRHLRLLQGYREVPHVARGVLAQSLGVDISSLISIF